MAKHSSDETSYRSKKARKYKIEEHSLPSQGPIVGYASIGKVGDRNSAPDKKKAKLVQQLFITASEGRLKLNELSDYAFSIGLYNSKTNKPYSKNAFLGWLKNPRYTGIIPFEGKHIVAQYTPIIEPDLFQKVQEVLEDRGHEKSAHT